MILAELLTSLRIELQDTDEVVWKDDTLIRAMEKSINLMSRLIPKRAVVETTIVREVTDETLAISSNSGTLTRKPVRVGSLEIPDKTLDTHYTIDYLTGIVTEKDSGLPDGDYTVDYGLDPLMLDISSLLPRENYIKMERVEYPAGDNPPTLITFEVFGELLLIRGRDVSLTEDRHLRIIYLKPWTAPTTTTEGDYPSLLDDAVIIGSVGQALIFKAEEYTQSAITSIAASKTGLDGISAVSLATAPDISGKITDAETALTAAIARLSAAATEVSKMDTPLGSANTALGKIATEIAAGKTYLESGDDLINAATRGEKAGSVYGEYAQVQAVLGQAYGREGEGYIVLANSWEAKAAREMGIGNSYLNEAIQRLTIVIRLLDKYRAEIDTDTQGISYYAVQLERARGYETTARQYLEIAGRYLASGQSKIQEMLIMLGLKSELSKTKALSGQPD